MEGLPFVFFCQQALNNLCVMYRCAGNLKCFYQLCLGIRFNMVLVPILRGTVFLCPSGVHIFLTLLAGLLAPFFWCCAGFFDTLVFLSGIAVAWSLPKASINHLPLMGKNTSWSSERLYKLFTIKALNIINGLKGGRPPFEIFLLSRVKTSFNGDSNTIQLINSSSFCNGSLSLGSFYNKK